MRERCVLDRLQYIFETVIAGIHGERMSVIRDGHMLVGVLANLEGPGPRSGGAVEGRVAAPAVWVDGLLLFLLPCSEEDGRGRPGLP